MYFIKISNMKHLISLIFLLNCLSSFAQEPAYTPMRLNYQFRGIKTDSLFLVPSYTDTTQANNYTAKNIPGSLIRTGSDFWMRNGIATAWLQNVNIGPGASPAVQFVDSVWRVVGKDSIFWRKGGVTNKIKDSTGAAYAGDSPDRIDGTATANVTANMASFDFVVNNSNDVQISASNNAELLATRIALVRGTDSVRVSSDNKIDIGLPNRRLTVQGNKLEFKDFNNTFLRIDTVGNLDAGDITSDNLHIKLSVGDSSFKIQSKAPSTWREKNSGLTSQVKTGYGENSINTTASSYEIKVPGTYIISNASLTFNIKLPDAAFWKGQSIQIVNTDGSDASLISLGGSIFDRGTGNNLNTVTLNKMMILYSDGTDWYGFEL